jgi:hypothetical protein
VVLLLAGAVWYAHRYYGAEIAGWLRAALGLLLVYLAFRLFADLLRVYLSLRARASLEREYLRQEREKTTECQFSRLKAEAELHEAAARANKAEQEAKFAVVTAGHDEAVFVREADPTAIWRPLHVIPAYRINGTDIAPTGLELGTWQYWLTARQGPHPAPPHTPTATLPPGTALPHQVDLPNLLYNGRGSLRNIIMGVRVDHLGRVSPIAAPLWRLVHIALGGVTDSGKSNLARAIAYQVLTAPEPVQVILTDLKRQTFKPFRDHDRLLYPIITDVADFLAVLYQLEAEIRARFKQFEPYSQVETLADYNRLATEPLPYIVTFVDEIAGILNGKEAQAKFLELILISRAAGIFFVAAGQRWSYQIIDTNIRDQFLTRFHFATNDPHSSKMLLGSPVASDIDRQGRAYAQLPFGLERAIVEVQAPFLDLETVIQALAPGSGPQQAMPKPPPTQPADKPTDTPTERQQAVLDLWDVGERSESVIASQVYGEGGRQVELVRKTLKKFGRM